MTPVASLESQLKRAVKKGLGFLGWSPSMMKREGLFGKYSFYADKSKMVQAMMLSTDYEPETQGLLRRTLRPGMVVLDIGAHIGFYSILVADLVGPSGRVYCFEAYRPNYRTLTRNLRANHFGWAEPYNLALSDRTGTATLSLNPINDGGHSLGSMANNPNLIGWDWTKLRKTVPTTTIDEFIREKGIGRVDFIKIDVEGAETLVFSGASKLLSRPEAPAICCEVGNKAQEQFGKTEGDLRDQLYAHKYRSFFIGPELIEFGRETPVEGLPNIYFRK